MIYLTWYGTFSFKLETNHIKILIDPYIRYEKRNDEKFKENFRDTKNIFITHGHLDHAAHLEELYKNKNVIIHTTKTPCNRLLKTNISKSNIKQININDVYEINNIKINVLKGKHIKFDLKLIFKEIFSKDLINYKHNIIPIIKQHLKCRENNETVAYLIETEGIKLLFLGSMALDKKTIYPSNVDYLVLAFQGRSDLDKKIVPILEKIKPKHIILGHFDNSFPPISKNVDISKVKKMKSVIIPMYDSKIKIK